MSFKAAFQTIRPSFLALSPICIMLGYATTQVSGSRVEVTYLALIVIAGIAAHISVNTLNEYFDFTSGLDFKTQKTPFSGGSGALPENPNVATTTLMIGIVSLVFTVSIGVYFLIETGFSILPIGLLGVILIVTYTQWINRSPLLCLIAPGLGFGILMVVGTHVILTGINSSQTWLMSLIPFFLINNLLLLNQYPDIEADAGVGRKTFPIAFGIQKSNIIYAVFLMAPFVIILMMIVRGEIPVMGIISLIPLLFSLFALSGARKHKAAIGDFPQYLAANVAAALLTPLLLSLAIIFA